MNVALFRVLRAFLGRFMGFVWVCVVLVFCLACVALYACGVRRIKGLWRICLSFSSFAPVFASFYARCPSLLRLSFFCPLALSLWLFGCGCCFLFPYGLYAKRKGAKVLPLASSLVLLWVAYKPLNITVISCGSSFQYLLPLQVIPATSSGRFVGSFTVCRSLSIVEYLQ